MNVLELGNYIVVCWHDPAEQGNIVRKINGRDPIVDFDGR